MGSVETMARAFSVAERDSAGSACHGGEDEALHAAALILRAESPGCSGAERILGSMSRRVGGSRRFIEDNRAILIDPNEIRW
jgi:hypothetical protein